MFVRSLFVPITVCTVLAAGLIPAAEAQDEPVESVPATITAMFGNWYELSQLDIDALDPATAEMVIQRGTMPYADDNAAIHYLRAMLGRPMGQRDLIKEGLDTPIADRLVQFRAGKYDDIVHNMEGIQQSIRAALVAGHCDWSPATEAGVGTVLPELGPMRQLARCQVLLADWHLAHDRPWTALRCYRDVLGMARDTGEGPYIIGALVGVAMEALALKHIEEAAPILIEQGVSVDRIARVIGRRYRQGANGITALSSERFWISGFGVTESTAFASPAAFWEMCANLSNMFISFEEEKNYDGPGMRTLAIESGFVAAENANNLAHIVRLALCEFEYINSVYDMMINAWDLSTSEYAVIDRQFEEMIEGIRNEHPLASFMVPAIGRMHLSMLAIERNRLALNLALAAAAERQARETWPQDLDQMRTWRPDLNTTDPVSSEKFGFKTSGESVTVSWVLTTQEKDRKFPKTDVKIVVSASR